MKTFIRKLKLPFKNFQSSILSRRTFDTVDAEKRTEFNETSIGCKLSHAHISWIFGNECIQGIHLLLFISLKDPYRCAPTFPFHSSRKASYPASEEFLARYTLVSRCITIMRNRRNVKTSRSFIWFLLSNHAKGLCWQAPTVFTLVNHQPSPWFYPFPFFSLFRIFLPVANEIWQRSFPCSIRCIPMSWFFF